MPAVTHRALLATVAAAALLAGCSSPVGVSTSLGEPDVAALDEHRTPYVGSSSAVVNLVGALGLDAFGERTVALTTDAPPYAVTLELASQPTDVTPEQADDLLAGRAALLLATIDNADEVRWEVAGRTGLLTRGDADALAGTPVAELGADADGLRDLARRLEG